MPAVSKSQQKLSAIALAMKRGETPYSYSEEAAKMAKTMSEKKLREFAKQRTKELKKQLKKKK